MKHRLFYFFLAALPIAAQSTQGLYAVTPLIGSGGRGDGGPATSAILDGPLGLAEDAEGNIYISEPAIGVIRKVRSNGVIERFAGSGNIADGAEGRAALETDLFSPGVLLTDRDGGLLFADSGACRIRKVQTDGTIRNLVGTGRCAGAAAAGPGGGGNRDRPALETDIATVSGMALDTSGRLIFSDQNANTVRRLDADGVVRNIAGSGSYGYGGDGEEATFASFRIPRGLAFDSAGNLYIADGASCRVRRVDTDGVIETVAGNGTCATPSTTFGEGVAVRSIGRVTALAYDPSTDSLLIASPGQARVLKLTLASSRLAPFLGDGRRRAVDAGTALQYSVDAPSGVLVSPRSGVLVADQTSFHVLQVQPGGAVSTFAGHWPQLATYPPAPSAELLRPQGLCVNSDGVLMVVDAGAERILSFRQPNRLAPLAGARYPTGYSGGDNGPATEAYLNSPRRVACAPDGSIYVTHGTQIRVINQQGVIQTTRTGLDNPSGIVIDPAGRLVYSEAGAHRVVRYDPAARTTTVIAGTGAAGFSGDGGSATEAALNSPGDLVIDSQGNLLIADRENRRVRRVSPAGTIQTIAGSQRAFWHTDTSGQLATDVGLDRIDGMAMDESGNLYVSEYLRISVVDGGGRIRILTGYVGEDNAGVKSYVDGPLNGCDGLAVDRSGRLYVSIRQGGRVLVASPPGVQPIDFGPPPSISPGGVVSSAVFGAFPSVAPGSWIEIYGSNLAYAARSWSAADFTGAKAPMGIDGTSVTIGGQAAFVAYVSPNQVNVQAPSTLGLGSQSVVVTTAAGASEPHPVTVNAAQPGLLAPPSFRVGGRQYVTALLTDGVTYVLPPGSLSGVATRLARPGETITLYGVGFGPVTPSMAAGEVVQQQNALTSPLRILFGETSAAVSYAGLAPGGIGLYQFNVIVPAVPPSEAVPLTFSLDGIPSQQTLFIGVQ